MKHFFARSICLIAVPLAIYILSFKVHFDMLPLSGEGDAAMSPEFQTSLKGYKFPQSSQAGNIQLNVYIAINIKIVLDVVYGSKVTMNHMAYRGGYLHSHEHQYPRGSKRKSTFEL